MKLRKDKLYKSILPNNLKPTTFIKNKKHRMLGWFIMSFDYLRAIKRPFTDFNKLSIGIIFLIIPFINIITGFFVKGYRLESARTAFNKKFEMPKWENFGSLFVRGLLSWIIGIIYMIPAIILILIAAGKILYNIIVQYGLNQGLSLSNTISDQLIQNTLMQDVAMIPVFIIGVLLALLAAYLIPIALVRYSEKYKFSSAFDFGMIFKKAFTGNFKLKLVIIGASIGVIVGILVTTLIGVGNLKTNLISGLILGGIIGLLSGIYYFLAVLAVLIYALIISLISTGLSLGFATINVQFLTIVLNLILSGLTSFIILITSYTIFGEVYSKLK